MKAMSKDDDRSPIIHSWSQRPQLISSPVPAHYFPAAAAGK
jgi:hypothetical protein